jgi:hypothetical protein
MSKDDGYTRPVLDTSIGGKDDIISYSGNQTETRTTIVFQRKLVTGDLKADHPLVNAFTK